MVDIGQQPSVVEVAALVGDRRPRLWYNLWLAIFLIGPALLALAVMGWLKAP